MRDPHVKILRYKLEKTINITYDQPPSVDIDYDEFSGRLESGILTCHMKEHYASIEAARKPVERYLLGWEIDAALTLGRGAIRFIYKDAQVIDRNPPPVGSALEIQAMEGVLTMEGDIANLRITRKEYPKPPKIFRVSSDVETLWHRYEMYLNGNDQLQAMAYFCLTLIESIAVDPAGVGRTDSNRRRGASNMFSIEYDVLNKLGELTSAKGDYLTARKAQTTPIPLSEREKGWIEAAIKKIIRRVGEYGPGQTLPKIEMVDLPPLSP